MSKYRINRSGMLSKPSSWVTISKNGRTYVSNRRLPSNRYYVSSNRSGYPVQWKSYRHLGARYTTENNNRYTGGTTSEYISYWGSAKVNIFSVAGSMFLFLLIFISAIRISNDMSVLSTENLLSFIGQFNDFAGILKYIELPNLNTGASSGFLAFVGAIANKFIDCINIFWALGKLLWKCIYIFIRVMIWVLFGG